MSTNPFLQKPALRVALPPSLGDAIGDKASRAAQLFSAALGERFTGYVAADYRQLLGDLRSGAAAMAWAPPIVCAQAEAVGLPVLGRGVRRGTASFRSALIGRKGIGAGLDKLRGKHVLWVDHDSAGGYLLAAQFLQKRGLEPSRLFSRESFVGSYQASVAGVLDGTGDVGVTFAAPAGSNDPVPTGLVELVPNQLRDLEVIAYSDDCPNDGLVLGMSALGHQDRFTQGVLKLQADPTTKLLLRSVFGVERFERVGPRAYGEAMPVRSARTLTPVPA